MREGTFKIDRAIRKVEAMLEDASSIPVREQAFADVLAVLREIRETDAGAEAPADETPFEMPKMEQRS